VNNFYLLKLHLYACYSQYAFNDYITKFYNWCGDCFITGYKTGNAKCCTGIYFCCTGQA